tara:strand:+ start:1572 stop:1934 length:363 start_codon:yes stop_codon:yes gene_type:complete
MKVGKYQFKDEKTALSKIKLLGVAKDEDGNEYATHKHTIVKLGNIILNPGKYNPDGKEIKAPLLSSKYHLDVAWQLEDTYSENGKLIKAEHPYGWKSASIDTDNNGVHSFYGVDYLTHKF